MNLVGKKIELVYEKDISQATFSGNLSPLHWDGAVARKIDRTEDAQLWNDLEHFVAPLFEQLSLVYGGLDICVDLAGNYCLIEINSQPAYKLLVESEGEQILVDLYVKIVQYMKETFG